MQTVSTEYGNLTKGKRALESLTLSCPKDTGSLGDSNCAITGVVLSLRC